MKNRAQLSSDDLSAYTDATERAFGANVDYGQISKTYSFRRSALRSVQFRLRANLRSPRAAQRRLAGLSECSADLYLLGEASQQHWQTKRNGNRTGSPQTTSRRPSRRRINRASPKAATVSCPFTSGMYLRVWRSMRERLLEHVGHPLSTRGSSASRPRACMSLRVISTWNFQRRSWLGSHREQVLRSVY